MGKERSEHLILGIIAVLWRLVYRARVASRTGNAGLAQHGYGRTATGAIECGTASRDLRNR
jgi:hypothetical protein